MTGPATPAAAPSAAINSGDQVKVHRTDWEGTIVIETDGDKYWICQPE